MSKEKYLPIFERFDAYFHENQRVLRLCEQGFHMITNSPRLVEAIAEYHQHDTGVIPEESKKKIESSREAAKFASIEIKHGFPTLHANSIVAIWSALESMVFDLIYTSLDTHRELLKNKDIGSLKMAVCDYESLDKDQLIIMIVRELEMKLKSEFKPGIERFEAIFNTIGFGGKVDKTTKKNLYEMYCVRNVFAHRAGIADKKFSEACPWLKIKSGEKIIINEKLYTKYLDSVVKYTVILIGRYKNKYTAITSRRADG